MANNYNSTLQSNNTDLQAILNAINGLPEVVEQATPTISVSSNGLITATAGTKASTYQLAFQAAKTITPSTANQIAVSSGYYTGGNITVAAIPSSYVMPSGTLNVTANGTHNVKNYVSVSVNVAGGSGGDASAEDGLVDGNLINYTNNRVISIKPRAFDGQDSLTTANFPNVTTIGSYAFLNCFSLTSISFPKVTTIEESAFLNCHNLPIANFPAAVALQDSVFCKCYRLVTANFPQANSIGRDAFNQCSALATISFPKASKVLDYAFDRCSSLTEVNLPMAKTMSRYAFYNCNALTTASFPAATTIASGVFIYCYNLKSLYLLGSSVCKLSASNAFSSTPIGGYSTSAGTYGSIYVPASILTSYKNATNWTYFSSRFVGI